MKLRGKRTAMRKRYRLTGKDREYLVTNLALLLRSAVPVGEALGSLAETSSSRTFKAALAQIQTDIDNGVSLHKALAESGIVSGQTLALIKLGEQSGNLVENLQVAAGQEEKQRIFQAKVRSALLYPAFVLGMTLIMGLGVSWFLLPRLSDTFASLQVELPTISKIFIGFGVFLKENGLWAVPVFFAVLALVFYIMYGWSKTNTLGRRLNFHLPGIKRLLYEVEVARFGYLLGTLLRAGLTVTQSLNLMYEATTAPPYKVFYAMLKHDFDNGVSFRSSLPMHRKQSKRLLPPAVQQMIIAAERSGALPETLLSIGRIYEEKTDVTTKNLETILEPILLVLVWIGVLLVAIAVIMPIYGLLGGVNSGGI